MSLVHDALRKARQAHAATPPTAAGPELRPLRNPTRPPRRAIPTRLFLVVGTVVLAAVVCWIWYGSVGHELPVRANSLPASPVLPPKPALDAVPPPASPTAAVARPAPVADTGLTSVAATPSKAPTDVAIAEPPPATDTPPAATPPAAETSGSPTTTFTLQGLLLYPRNPVAIINGQTVSVGSHVSDARVVSIDLHSVTIVTAAGRTNVLEMAEQ